MITEFLKLSNKIAHTNSSIRISLGKYQKAFGKDYLDCNPGDVRKINKAADDIITRFKYIKFTLIQDLGCSWKFASEFCSKIIDLSFKGEYCGEYLAFSKIIKPIIMESKIELNKADIIFCFGDLNVLMINRALQDPILKNDSNFIIASILEHKASTITQTNLRMLLKGRDFNDIVKNMGSNLQKFLDDIYENKLVQESFKDKAIFDRIFAPQEEIVISKNSDHIYSDSGIETSPHSSDSLELTGAVS